MAGFGDNKEKDYQDVLRAIAAQNKEHWKTIPGAGVDDTDPVIKVLSSIERDAVSSPKDINNVFKEGWGSTNSIYSALTPDERARYEQLDELAFNNPEILGKDQFGMRNRLTSGADDKSFQQLLQLLKKNNK